MNDAKYYLAKYNDSRRYLIIMLAFSALNVLLIALQADVYFLFSSIIPLWIVQLGIALVYDGAASTVGLLFAVLALITLLPYLAAYFLSAQKGGWLIASLVLFSIDSAISLYFWVISGFVVSDILMLAFHAWVLYYLIIGVQAWNKIKALGYTNISVLTQTLAQEQQFSTMQEEIASPEDVNVTPEEECVSSKEDNSDNL